MEKITVLLVEDEQTLAMIIKDTLEGQNFIIHTAADGEEQELIIRIKALVGKAFSFTEEKPKETTVFEIGDYRFNSVTQRLAFAGSTPTSPNADTEVELSHRESEILKRLCENRNQVVNTQNVLLDLWGDDSFFNSRSLHVFITKLRHKLAGDERIRIVNVRGIGYKLIVN